MISPLFLIVTPTTVFPPSVPFDFDPENRMDTYPVVSERKLPTEIRFKLKRIYIYIRSPDIQSQIDINKIWLTTFK